MPKVDAKGRVVLPKAIRERLGIAPGAEVEIREEDGKAVVELEESPDEIIADIEAMIDSHGDTDSVADDELDPISKDHVETIRRGTGSNGESPEESDAGDD
ncbi:AbrB/MazE/SpoVT family DNA-binding domain-containing protein [Salinirubrum litoreum]|uniref:AbrB/MazE/SpoVT family DNA-binding domain-containing protein n=1 Tax=Salinirubrum litoreum TaxID=1126234 RepID=A0ABD5RCH8_9EURY|nr:AbrB/MazE/SpoVT family DNA-binding domain-containing protein [Salinirubrum litoreum]